MRSEPGITCGTSSLVIRSLLGRAVTSARNSEMVIVLL
jgi:hypothetical protein